MDVRQRLKYVKLKVDDARMRLPAMRHMAMQAALRRPRQLCIETTSECNAACPMCPREQMHRPMGLMDRELYSRIIEEAAAWGVPRLGLQMYGDPLFMPDGDLDFYLSQARKCRWVAFSTNGQLLTRKKAEIIVRNRVDEIQVDMDGADKATYEQIRINCNFEKVGQNIRTLISVRNEMGRRRPRVVLGAVVMPLNEHQIHEIRDQWKGVVDGFAFGGLSSRGGAIEAPQDNGNGTACYLPWHQLNVASDGSVSLCCNDWDVTHPIGNVREQTLQQIWSGEALRAVRKTMVTGEGELPEVCSNCNEWHHYGGRWWQSQPAAAVPY